MLYYSPQEPKQEPTIKAPLSVRNLDPRSRDNLPKDLPPATRHFGTRQCVMVQKNAFCSLAVPSLRDVLLFSCLEEREGGRVLSGSILPSRAGEVHW